MLVAAVLSSIAISQDINNTVNMDFKTNSNEEFKAVFEGPQDGYVNTPIEFHGDAEGGKEPYFFEWDFGDGSEANLLQNPIHTYQKTGTYTITLTVTDSSFYEEKEDTTTATIHIKDENNKPEIDLVKPTNGIYLNGNKIFPIKNTLIIGDIKITADATDFESGIKNVTFSINGEVKEEVIIPPYEWLWDTGTFGKNTITVTAYDHTGNHAKEEITVFKII